MVQCTYTQNWDSNGVLYFLGRMASTSAVAQGLLPPERAAEWCNPGMAGMVRVHCGERGYVGCAPPGPTPQPSPAGRGERGGSASGGGRREVRRGGSYGLQDGPGLGEGAVPKEVAIDRTEAAGAVGSLPHPCTPHTHLRAHPPTPV